MGTDKYRIDDHKLIYHVPRVNAWLNGENIYPIYLEISPAGMCNHRCTFCALDFMEYRRRHLNTDVLKQRLSEMAGLGIKSIMYAGEGEPFLHKQIADIIHHTKRCGIDVAVTTNGVLLKEELAEKILGDVEWIKVSLNAGKKETYADIHRTHPSDMERVIRNMSYCAQLKRKKGYKCTLGVQLLLLPENRDEVPLLAEIAKDMGMDYLVVKPYSQHRLSRTNRYGSIKYDTFSDLNDTLQKYNDSNFNVIFRSRTMKKWDNSHKSYNRCLAHPFWAYLDAGGNVWGCSSYLEDERFLYGNIYESSFSDIWEGEKRSRSLQWIDEELNTQQCRVNCRMDEINRYLWELKHPQEHVNFI